MRVQIDEDLRDIFGKLQKLDDVAAEITYDWVAHCRSTKAHSGPSEKDFNSLWSKSYLDIEQVIVALSKHANIEISETLDDNGHRSFHLDLLQTITKADSLFCGLFLRQFHINMSRDQRVFGFHESGCKVSVHNLLDSARKFRNWYLFKSEGSARPTMNDIQIAFPGGLSIQSWYHIIIRILVEAFKVCWENEMSTDDLTRRLVLGQSIFYRKLT